MDPTIKAFFHANSSTLTYVLSDPGSGEAAVIDPVMNFDASSGQVSWPNAEQIIEYVKSQRLEVKWILETHAHADHISGAQYIKQHLGGEIAIGRGICQVQKTFKNVFNLEADFAVDGSQFDHLLDDGETLALGSLTIEVLNTPGHTNDSVTYVVGKNAFVGDTLFMPDSGTARCDFPGGDAELLYDSVQRIYALGDDVTIWVCHDYQPNDRALNYKATVAEHKAANIHVNQNTGKNAFVEVRQTRDATLAVPKLLYPSVQVNIRAGHLPKPEANGSTYIKLPIKL